VQNINDLKQAMACLAERLLQDPGRVAAEAIPGVVAEK
jgi:hypothetical protein